MWLTQRGGTFPSTRGVVDPKGGGDFRSTMGPPKAVGTGLIAKVPLLGATIVKMCVSCSGHARIFVCIYICKHSTSSMCTYGHTVTCRPRMHPADYSCILWTTQTSCVHKRCTCMPRMLTACTHICTCMLRMLADTPHLHAAHACREMSCITFPNPATDIMHYLPYSCDR